MFAPKQWGISAIQAKVSWDNKYREAKGIKNAIIITTIMTCWALITLISVRDEKNYSLRNTDRFWYTFLKKDQSLVAITNIKLM